MKYSKLCVSAMELDLRDNAHFCVRMFGGGLCCGKLSGSSTR